MKRTVRRFFVLGEMAMRRVFADRGGLAFSVAFYLLVSVVLGTLWRAAAGHGQITGYTAAALTWYVVTSEAAICALPIRLIEEIGDEIGGGAISVELLRPVSVVAVRVAAATGRAWAQLSVMIPAGAVLAFIVAGRPPNLAAAALAIPSLGLAVAANLAMQHAFAAGSFWLRDSKTGWFIYQKFVFILGGMVIPLQVLPDALRSVAFVLPFQAMAYAPARLASGHFEPGLLIGQVLWLVVCMGLATAAFASGERRLQVVGG